MRKAYMDPPAMISGEALEDDERKEHRNSSDSEQLRQSQADREAFPYDRDQLAVAVTRVPAELEVLRSINSSVGGAGRRRRRKLELIPRSRFGGSGAGSV